MSELENKNIEQEDIDDENTDYIKYLSLIFNAFILQNDETKLYYLDPLYLFFMRKTNLMPEDLGIDISLEELKEALRLEVERRNSYFNIIYTTIKDIRKGIENFDMNETSNEDIKSMTELIKNVQEIENSKPNIPAGFNGMNFNQRKH